MSQMAQASLKYLEVQTKMNDLVDHNCPIQGPMMIEANKPCNWCDELDNIDIIKQEKKEVIENGEA